MYSLCSQASSDSSEGVSVVICARNASRTIESCIQSTLKYSPTEVIVIDGVSSDDTVRIASRYPCKVYSDEGRGIAYARQLGAEKARTPYLVFVDADVELLGSNALLTLLNELIRNNWAAIHAQIVDDGRYSTYWDKCESVHWEIVFNRPIERKYMSTAACMMRRDLILRYKLDTSFVVATEDGDFFYRISKDGYRFGVSTARAFHHHRSSFGGFVRQRINYGRGNARFALKHREAFLQQLFAPLVILFGGVVLSVRHRPGLIPFYMVWGVSLFLGLAIGFRELVCAKTS